MFTTPAVKCSDLLNAGDPQGRLTNQRAGMPRASSQAVRVAVPGSVGVSGAGEAVRVRYPAEQRSIDPVLERPVFDPTEMATRDWSVRVLSNGREPLD